MNERGHYGSNGSSGWAIVGVIVPFAMLEGVVLWMRKVEKKAQPR